MTTHDRLTHDRLRRIGDTVGETAELLGSAESRLTMTTSEVLGETTRSLGSAAARTAREVRPGSADALDDLGSAAARTIEAGGELASTLLEAGGTWARTMIETATDVVVDAAARREAHEQAESAAATPARPVPGPS